MSVTSGARYPGPDTPRHNLPARLTSFVGREREIADVRVLLGTRRLVTLVGAPGVGKTRLGLQIAVALLDRFPDGVWLVELAPLADPDLAPQAVADVLGVREQPGRSLTATLAEHLRSRRLLLVLDNCEHLIGAAAALAETLLQACPGLHVLATSREPLAAEGEVTRRVPSLTVPGVEGQQAESEAVRLFVERAQAVAPSFALTEQLAERIGQICARLDGIPLAIELAAARVRTLSVEQIAARLDDRFRLLTGGRRTALPRQQTLRGAVDWSYDLLVEPERVLLRRLAVFAGGFMLAAAEAICDPAERDAVLDLLTGLVDKSLVQADAGGESERRYRLLETLRQYGHEKLTEHGEIPATRARHCDYVLTFVKDVAPHVTGPGQKEALARLEDEHDNLRAALAWCLEEAHRGRGAPPVATPAQAASVSDPAVRLVSALWRFWWLRGHPAEGRRWVERALAAPRSDQSPEEQSIRAHACLGAAHLSTHLADYRAAIAHIEEALTLWRTAQDDRGVATGLQRLGLYLVHVGEAERGIHMCEEGVALARTIGDSFILALTIHSLGIAAWYTGHVERSETLNEECLGLFRDLGFAGGMAYTLRLLGRVAGELGAPERAVRLLEESLRISRELRERGGFAEAHQNLARIARFAGDPDRAIEMLRISLPAHRDLGERWLIAISLHDLAGVMTVQGAIEQDTPSIDPLDTPAPDERLLAGVRIFAAAEALREQCGVVLPVPIQRTTDRDLAVLHEHLSDDLFARAWAEGRAMSFEQTVEYALAVLGSAGPDTSKRAVETETPPLDPQVALLTPREREVVALVAQGRTNPQIATALVLSGRTVDSHVHNVLGKLGFATRAQVAVWAVEHGLGGTQ